MEETAYNDSVSDYKILFELQDATVYRAIPSLAFALSTSFPIIITVVIPVIIIVTVGTIVAVIVVVLKKQQTNSKTRPSFTSPLAINPETNSEMATEVKKQEATVTASKESLNATSDASEDVISDNFQGNVEEGDSKWQLIDLENSKVWVFSELKSNRQSWEVVF